MRLNLKNKYNPTSTFAETCVCVPKKSFYLDFPLNCERVELDDKEKGESFPPHACENVCTFGQKEFVNSVFGVQVVAVVWKFKLENL